VHLGVEELCTQVSDRCNLTSLCTCCDDILCRPDWVSNTVHDNIYKVISSYIERLRRKAVLIDESRASGIVVRRSTLFL
jgi:hypothetical protein